MHKTFTPVIWAFQNFAEPKVDNLIIVDELLQTSSVFEKLIEKLEAKAPEVPENVIKKIFEKV